MNRILCLPLLCLMVLSSAASFAQGEANDTPGKPAVVGEGEQTAEEAKKHREYGQSRAEEAKERRKHRRHDRMKRKVHRREHRRGGEHPGEPTKEHPGNPVEHDRTHKEQKEQHKEMPRR